MTCNGLKHFNSEIKITSGHETSHLVHSSPGEEEVTGNLMKVVQKKEDRQHLDCKLCKKESFHYTTL